MGYIKRDYVKVGYSYRTPKNSTLTVVDIIGKEYILECSECSKDKELCYKGSIVSTRDGIARGCCPCGCTDPVKYKNEQWRVRAQRVADETGFTIIEIKEDERGKITNYCKIIYKCNKHNELKYDQPIGLFVNNNPNCKS